jgi:gliding motility-associatede transport system auxiliary component
MKARTSIAVVLVLGAILFFAVNILSATLLSSARLDLTQERLFTLSTGTRHILKDLKEPITLRLYYSQDLASQYPGLRAYAGRVQDLLREYDALGGSNLKLEIINPEPFTPEEDQAVSFGLQGAPVGNGDTMYFGLVGTNSTDKQSVIPFFDQDREQFLEYDLTHLVDKLSNRKRSVVGIMSSLPLAYGPGGPMAALQGQSRPYQLYQQISENYDVKMIDEEVDKIDDSISVLVIVNPGDLSDYTLYAIDQFVLRGGRALVFVDPYSEIGASAAIEAAQSRMPAAAIPDSSDLKKLLNAWGVDLAKNEVVGDLGRAQRVQMNDPDGRRRVVDYLVWAAFRDGDFSKDDVVTANLTSLNMASIGHLNRTANATTNFEPLVSTSRDTEILDSAKLRGQPQPDDLTRDFVSSNASYTVAARVSGDVNSAFPGGPPPPDAADKVKNAPKDDAEPPPAPKAQADVSKYLAKSVEPINVIVVADTDMWDDKFWAQTQNFLGQRVVVPIADNASFVINAIDNLSGSNDLIGLRSRGTSNRPFTLVEQIRKSAEQQYLAKEQKLQDDLDQAKQRIAELQSQRPGDAAGAALLSPQQEEEIEQFRGKMVVIRQQLRDVQRDLRKDIESLENWTKVINIGLVPVLVLLIALIAAYSRHRRRTRGGAPTVE